MKTVQLVQGSTEWHAHRAQHFNASDAPAMMGCSPYETRTQLLHRLHTGIAAEVDAATQRRFDDGHRFEALARPLAEPIVGEDLYPVVGVSHKYSASFDGLTLMEDVAWEHKAMNDTLRALPADVVGDAAVGAALPLVYRVQIEHQLMVSGAGRCLFTASNWSADNTLTEIRHCWYEPDVELRAAIIAGWQQFAADLAAYVPPAAAEPAKPAQMESLPAVAVRLDGALTVAGNLPTFAEALKAFIARIPAKPKNDDEFATCDAACKALKKAEEALDAAEAGALASITDVEAMRRAVADCRKLARDTRLAAEKMVERRKVQIKEEAVAAARRELDAHIAGLNAELAPMALRPVPVDFAGAIRGLRSFASMDDALRTAVASGKIAADAQAKGIRANVATFKASTGDDTALQALFADLGQIVHKAADDFAALVDNRIATHRANEAAKEAKRQADEAARIAAAESRARQEAAAAERQRIADEQAKRQQPADSGPAAELLQDHSRGLSIAPASKPKAPMLARQAAADIGQSTCCANGVPGKVCPECAETSRAYSAAMAPVRADEPASLSLGTICGRLSFTVSAAFLADVLHVTPARTEKAGRHYTETQYQTICRQLIAHVGAVAELYAGETV